MSWISPHNLGSKNSPASKQPGVARFSPQPRFAPQAQSPAAPTTYASPSGGYAPETLVPDEFIPNIAPPPMLNKRTAPSPQSARQQPMMAPRTTVIQQRPQQPVQQPVMMHHAPTRTMRSPVRTQVMRSPVVQQPMVQQRFVQPQVTEMIAPPVQQVVTEMVSPQIRSPMRPMMVAPPVQHSPMRVQHMMAPPMPMMADPYYEDIPFHPGDVDPTETDFDGPSFGGMPEEHMMPPANYPGYMPTYQDPRGYYEEGYSEPQHAYPNNDHGLVPEVETYEQHPMMDPDPNFEPNAPPPPRPHPPRYEVDPPPPRQEPAPPPPRPDPAPDPAPPPPNQSGGDPFASLPAPARETIKGPDREPVKVKVTPDAPVAVRAAPPPQPTMTRAAPPPAAATMTRAAPPPSAPSAVSGAPQASIPAPSQPSATMPASMPQGRTSQPNQPYTDDLHEYEEDLIARIESTLAEANRTLEEHSNRYPIRGADGK